MKEIFKAGFYRLMFQAFNFLVGLFIAALAGAEMFGTISLMVVNAALLLLLTGLGTDQAIVWHGAGKKLDANKLFTFSFVTALFQILIFLSVALFFLNITGKTVLTKSISFPDFFPELIYFSGIVLLDKYVSLLYAQHKARICNLLLAAVTGIALLILVAARFNFTSIEINPFLFFCLLPIAQALVIVFFFHIKTPAWFSGLNKPEIKSFFNFSLLVFVSNIIQFLAYRIDYWFIEYFSNTTVQVGIYAQANRFAALLWIVPNIIAALIIPVLSSPQNKFDINEVAGITRVLNYLNLAITGFIIFSSYIVYIYFLQSSYAGGFLPLIFMLPGFYFFSITLLLAAYFSAKNILWINFTASLICLSIIVVLDYFLIPIMGIKGAAIANSIAYTASSLFTIILFLKISKLRLADIFAFKKSDWKLMAKLRS